MASVCTVGGHTFEDNEVNLVSLSRSVRYSPRGKRLQTVTTVRAVGELFGTDTDSVMTKVRSAEAALSKTNPTFRYAVNGVNCHSLDGGGSLSGVHVLDFSFPRGDPAELATTRTFSFTLEATFDNSEDDLITFTDSIETIGNASQRFFVLETFGGLVGVVTSLTTPQYFRRVGSAIGYTKHPSPPGPANGVEMGWRRVISRDNGRRQGNGAFRFFTTKWSYFSVTPPGFFVSFF